MYEFNQLCDDIFDEAYKLNNVNYVVDPDRILPSWDPNYMRDAVIYACVQFNLGEHFGLKSSVRNIFNNSNPQNVSTEVDMLFEDKDKLIYLAGCISNTGMGHYTLNSNITIIQESGGKSLLFYTFNDEIINQRYQFYRCKFEDGVFLYCDHNKLLDIEEQALELDMIECEEYEEVY